ncbi:MAG: FxsA family protein [bacterium]
MLLKLILLFTIVPLVEFYILIKIGTIIGAGATILIVLVTGIMGGIFARAQGLRVIQHLISDLGQGIFPAEPLWNGLFVLIGAIFLITPGLLTDLLGFFCIIPFTREPLKKLAKKYIGKKLEQNGVVHLHWDGF